MLSVGCYHSLSDQTGVRNPPKSLRLQSQPYLIRPFPGRSAAPLGPPSPCFQSLGEGLALAEDVLPSTAQLRPVRGTSVGEQPVCFCLGLLLEEARPWVWL